MGSVSFYLVGKLAEASFLPALRHFKNSGNMALADILLVLVLIQSKMHFFLFYEFSTNGEGDSAQAASLRGNGGRPGVQYNKPASSSHGAMIAVDWMHPQCIMHEAGSSAMLGSC